MAEILKVLEMPDGSTSVIIQGKRRYAIREFVAEEPYYKASVSPLSDVFPLNDTEFNAIVGSLKDLSIKIAQFSANVPPEATFAVKNIENSTFLINFICSNTDISVEEKQNLLEIESLKERGIQAISYLVKEVQMLELKNDIPVSYTHLNGHTFITRSTVSTRETVEVDGTEYPLYKLEISNTSHPFYTGKVKLVDTAGRVDKFMSRYGKHMEDRRK